jgi:exonuclease III
LRLVSWNVAGRVRSQPQQAEALLGEPYDVVCLQEVTPTSASLWQADLEAAGFAISASQLEPGARGSRRLGVVIAARVPIAAAPAPELPWPERHHAARIELPAGAVEVHTLHAPLSQKEGQVKVLTLEALNDWLSAPADVPRILCGDLNTPQYESREGEVQTFARTRSGRIRPAYGERHDAAELALVTGLPEAHGWTDAFRSLHGYLRRDRSWRMGRHPGYRLDHVLLSRELEPIACDYRHELREGGLSDHSAIWAEIASR